MLLPCNHWTMRNPIRGPNRSPRGSSLIRTAGGARLYLAGDAAHLDRFGELGREFGEEALDQDSTGSDCASI
jgi:N-acyl-phosphatidylethanolamine-hydrolysing phospholipase D